MGATVGKVVAVAWKCWRQEKGANRMTIMQRVGKQRDQEGID